MKQDALKSIEIKREMDKGKDFEKQKFIQNLLHIEKEGLHIGMKYLEQWKNEYDIKYRTGDFSSMPHYALEFDGILPFVCCGGFLPEVDLKGERLQIITRGNSGVEIICLNVSVMGNKTFAVFGWNGTESGPAQKFAESFSKIPEPEKANTLLHVAIEQLENTYFRPSWWKSLSDFYRAHLMQRVQNGTGLNPQRSVNTYKNLHKILKKVPVSNEIASILNAC